MTFAQLMHKLRTCAVAKHGERFTFVERARQ